ncbi:hypothetical protein QQF64_012064 [Cirrhinus molitorella]|uniref:CCHC-type domain-containing protein n=1 Tax=Cirrhinus molitorella TaxID=172907 RepID=A0ABR3LUH1_9TELE
MARQTEAVKQQQSNLRGECAVKTSGSVDRVISRNNPSQSWQRVKSGHGAKEKFKQSHSRCHKCGKSPSHPKAHCPANTVLCHACGKKGHFQKVCVSPRKVNEVQEQDLDIFLGTVLAEGDPWVTDIKIKDCDAQFKIDTGAEVTVMPDHVFHEISRTASLHSALCCPISFITPRRIPLPHMPKVKNELQWMERLGVISRVEEPTEWCAGIVVVPKKSGDPRICVDLTKLNESVRREKYILPSAEQTLGLLAGASVFSKLNANMGF